MSLELWNTFGTFGTFAVIAATAIAALVQLRHARGGNQIAALTELQVAQQTPQFIAAVHFVRTELANKLKDPEFRYQMANPNARTSENQPFITHALIVGNYYEQMGVLVRTGLIDRNLALNVWSDEGPGEWRRLAPVLAMIRRTAGQAAWENFEYLTVLSEDWVAAHPNGDYPADVRRIAFKDEWLEADTQYAATRAPA